MKYLDGASVSSRLVSNVSIPRFFFVQQNFENNGIVPQKIPFLLNELLMQEEISSTIKPGMRIAITVGSRGLSNLFVLVKDLVAFVKSRGGVPFIVPSMGSHGGATAEGQRQVLEGYGITEGSVGCSIVSSMDVVCIGKTKDGRSVFIDQNAANANGIIVFCRIKPHTAFRGEYESGILKMMAIGLGKQQGAELCHASGFKDLAENVAEFGRTVLHNAPILFAVSIIENAFEETAKIFAVPKEKIECEEPKLLRLAYSMMPQIMKSSCDVLIVDKIGKNYSGDGMDPNITGTFSTPYATGGIQSQRVCVLDLSEETHGNGVGIGMAHATTRRAVDKLDLDGMYANVITSTVLGGVKIPMVMVSDKAAIQVCIRTCCGIDKNNPRIIRIPNSMQISKLLMSEAYYEEVKNDPHFTILGLPQELEFDSSGNLF